MGVSIIGIITNANEKEAISALEKACLTGGNIKYSRKVNFEDILLRKDDNNFVDVYNTPSGSLITFSYEIDREIFYKEELAKNIDYLYFNISETVMCSRFTIYSLEEDMDEELFVFDRVGDRIIEGDNFLNIQDKEDIFQEVLPRAMNIYMPENFHAIDLATPVSRYILRKADKYQSIQTGTGTTNQIADVNPIYKKQFDSREFVAIMEAWFPLGGKVTDNKQYIEWRRPFDGGVEIIRLNYKKFGDDNFRLSRFFAGLYLDEVEQILRPLYKQFNLKVDDRTLETAIIGLENVNYKSLRQLITDETSMEQRGVEIRRCIVDGALPFFEKYKSLSVVNAMMDGLLKSQRGSFVSGIVMLNMLVIKKILSAPDYNELFREVRQFYETGIEKFPGLFDGEYEVFQSL